MGGCLQEVPVGHPECLEGKAFVITGTLDSLYRKEAEDLIKRHSGRVVGSVSSKTDFLVAGMGCGASKLKAVSPDSAGVLLKSPSYPDW